MRVFVIALVAVAVLAAAGGCISSSSTYTIEQAIAAAHNISDSESIRVVDVAAVSQGTVVLWARGEKLSGVDYLTKRGGAWHVEASSLPTENDIEGVLTVAGGGVSAGTFNAGWMYGRVTDERVVSLVIETMDWGTQEVIPKNDTFLVAKEGLSRIRYTRIVAFDKEGQKLAERTYQWD